MLPPKPGGRFERLQSELRKAYPSIDTDLATEYAALVGPNGPPVPCGARISLVVGFSGKVIKVRVASSDQASGKSGGFRVLLYRVRDEEWQPIMVWAKSRIADALAKDVRTAIDEDV